MTERTKVVKVVEWNNLRRVARSHSAQLIAQEARLEALEQRVAVLGQTLLVPAGKVLGK